MAKGKVTLSDFPVASRRRPSTTDVKQPTAELDGTEDVANEKVSQSLDIKKLAIHSKSQFVTPEERRTNDTKEANKREDSRNRLRQLRRDRERESKHFVNVSLDYDTKRRLEKAAHENGLKMSVILRDAIDQYLTENGY